MKSAQDLQGLIEIVKGKLAAENIDPQDYDASVECLSKCVAPIICIEVYEQYINY